VHDKQIVVTKIYRLLRRFLPETAKIIVRYDIPSNSTVLYLPAGLSWVGSDVVNAS